MALWYLDYTQRGSFDATLRFLCAPVTGLLWSREVLSS